MFLRYINPLIGKKKFKDVSFAIYEKKQKEVVSENVEEDEVLKGNEVVN